MGDPLGNLLSWFLSGQILGSQYMLFSHLHFKGIFNLVLGCRLLVFVKETKKKAKDIMIRPPLTIAKFLVVAQGAHNLAE